MTHQEEAVGYTLQGLNPASLIGVQLGVRIGEWHPLWRYCCLVSPDVLVAADWDNGHRHLGHVVSVEKASGLGSRLKDAFFAGQVAMHAESRHRPDPSLRELAESIVRWSPETARQLEDTFDEISVMVFLNFCADSGGFVIW